MVRIQQSIEISVPVHVAYNRLTQFEDYPRFMQDVAAVYRLDDTHLHWTTTMSNRDVEWDAAITEQIPDRCVAWHNTSGPMNAGKLEVLPAGPQASRVTLILESEPEQAPGSSTGNNESEMAHKLEQDMTRMKEFLEAEGAPVPTSSFAAGSEGWDGTEDPEAPVVSAAHHAATQTDQVPPDIGATGPAATEPFDAMAKSMRQEEKQNRTKLKKAIEDAIPPSEEDD
jgi:hypothetical protein